MKGEDIHSDAFTGAAYIEPMIANEEIYHFPQTNNVTFEPGARSSWHSHGAAPDSWFSQMVIFDSHYEPEEGMSLEGEPVEILYPGDVALCPPGVKHWHGGSADTSFAHIAVNTNPELTGLEWFNRISDEEYAVLPTEKETAGQ